MKKLITDLEYSNTYKTTKAGICRPVAAGLTLSPGWRSVITKLGNIYAGLHFIKRSKSYGYSLVGDSAFSTLYDQ